MFAIIFSGDTREEECGHMNDTSILHKYTQTHTQREDRKAHLILIQSREWREKCWVRSFFWKRLFQISYPSQKHIQVFLDTLTLQDSNFNSPLSHWKICVCVCVYVLLLYSYTVICTRGWFIIFSVKYATDGVWGGLSLGARVEAVRK